MKLSILVNVYNGENDLPYLFDSLLKQTNQDFEFVIVDDGSTDRTVQIIQEYATKFKNLRLITVPHIGLRLARNLGFQSVTGNICLILDADEILPAVDAIERFMEPFADPQVAGVGGIKLPANNATWIADGYRVINWAAYNARIRADGTTEMVVGGAMALRVKAVNEVGGLTTHPDVGEDCDISWRLSAAGWKLVSRNDIIILHRDPTTVVGAYRHGYKPGKRAFVTYSRHPRKFLSWKTWTRFYPLFVIFLLLISRSLGFIAIVFSYLSALWIFRNVPASWLSKSRGWVVWTIHNLGWDIGFLAGILKCVRGKTG